MFNKKVYILLFIFIVILNVCKIHAHKSDGKQSSLVTIFALWNTKMGTSFLTIPWTIEQAGIIPFFFLLIVIASVSFYTANIFLQVYDFYACDEITDLASLCNRLLGKWARWASVIFCVIVLLGCAIVYYILLCNFLYNSVDFIYIAATAPVRNFSANAICPTTNSTAISSASNVEPGIFHKLWHEYNTVPLILALVMGPLLCIRSPTFFTKFNSFGTLSVLYIFVFVVAKWAIFSTHINMRDSQTTDYSPLFNANWRNYAASSGTLSLMFFIHAAILPMMKNNRVQANNKRDMGIAYILVCLTFTVTGGIFYISFPLPKSCLQDNLLNNFLSTDIWSFVGRIFLFIQLFTCYPLNAYILRVVPYNAVYHMEPTRLYTIVSSAVITGICIVFAVWLPSIGTIIRFVGALCSIVYVYVLPFGLYHCWQQRMNKTNHYVTAGHIFLTMLAVISFVLQFTVSS